MVKRLVLVIGVAVLAAACHPSSNEYEAVASITPAPVSFERGSGSFELKGSAIRATSPEAEKIACSFVDKLAAASGVSVRSAEDANIIFSIDDSLDLPAEGYSLTVTESMVEAVGKDAAGLFYAVQSLYQLLPPQIDGNRTVRNADWTIPCVSVRDYPRFAWRGVHVDPCRHFLPVEAIKKHIDILAGYKINTIHLHLTDDQGWRIEIKKYPKLTEIGGWRTEFDGSVHGGFYTQEEMKELVAYAADRFVTLVPEIEMPGHAIAAVRAYPELSCEKKQIGTFYTWGTTNTVFCIGDEHTFEFLEDVVEEVSAIFPGEYFHIGGDECLKDKWEVCPACQARIAAEGLKSDEEFTAEQKLQSYAVGRMEKILEKYGKKLVGWDEILEGGLSPNATVMSWQGEQGGIAAAQQGHDVVMTPSHEGLYLDSYQGDSKAEPLGFGRYIPLEKIYTYNPVPEALEQDGLSSYVIGVQANLWSEYLYDLDQREYMLFPRALALAEIAWSPLEVKDFNDFIRRVDDASFRFECQGVKYHIPLPEQPGGSCSNLVLTDSKTVSFKTTRPEKMVYTLDGKDPGKNSKEYTGPLTFTDDAVIKIRTVLPGGQMSRVRTVNVKKQALVPASGVENPDSGLVMRKTYGRFLKVADLDTAGTWESLKIRSLSEITSQEARPRDMQNVKFYAAEAEGYLEIPQSGVWRFSTDSDQLWIDGELVVNNDGLVKRYSRNDGEIALEAGLHPVKILFLSNVAGGWTTARNDGSVKMKISSDEDFSDVEPEQLFN